MTAGKKVKIQYFDGTDWQTVGHADAETSINMENIPEEKESDGWKDAISGTVEVSGLADISWNETWLVAYQARMYAGYFKN